MADDRTPFVERDIDPSTLTNTTAFPIERGIPMPMQPGGYVQALYNGRGRPPVYPWHLMNVMESFLVPGAKIKAMSAKASQAGARMSRRFECRTVEGGVRVLRTE